MSESVEEEFEKMWQGYDEVTIDEYIPPIYTAARNFYLAGRADERKRIQAIIYDQTEKYNRDTMANLADLIERQEGI